MLVDLINYVSVFYRNLEWDKELLVIVCDIGYVNIVIELIRVGVDVNFKNGFNFLIICVCKKGYENLVEECIKVGVYVNVNYVFDDYEILFIVVCRNGCLDVVKLLIKVGVDIYLGNENNMLMIVVCCMRYL